jgi:DNA primase
MYRSMVRIIRQRPVESIRWLKGTVGRDLFALQAWRDQRRLADGPR